VLTEQGCCNTDVDTTGRAAGLQEDSLNGLAFSDGKDLVCSFDECIADVGTASGYHTGVSQEDVLAASIKDIGCFPRSWQTTELFRTDGDPGRILEQPEAYVVCLCFTIIPCAETDKAGTDKVEGPWGVIFHVQE